MKNKRNPLYSGPKLIEQTYGLGVYRVSIRWHFHGYNNNEGIGNSLYEVRTGGQRVTGAFETLEFFIKQNTVKRIESIDISDNSLFVVLNTGYDKTYIETLAQGSHFSGLAYVQARYNSQNNPTLFGSWNKNRIFKHQVANILLDDSIDEYYKTNDVNAIHGLKGIKFPNGEYDRMAVNFILNRKIIGSVCLFDTPEFGHSFAEMYASSGKGIHFNNCEQGDNWYEIVEKILNDNR